MDSEDFAQYMQQTWKLIVAYTDQDDPILAEEFFQKSQSWIQHAKPPIVAIECFSFFTNNFAEPFTNDRMIYIVAVNPLFITGIVWGINIDALHLSGVIGQ